MSGFQDLFPREIDICKCILGGTIAGARLEGQFFLLVSHEVVCVVVDMDAAVVGSFPCGLLKKVPHWTELSC